MPVIKRAKSHKYGCRSDLFRFCSEAHRALELLEEYHSRLSSPSDKPLRQAIERVIRIFKSQLFQALLDIQEFYEVTLLDENKTTEQKTREALGVAHQWEGSQSKGFLAQGRRTTSVKSVKINETVSVEDGSALMDTASAVSGAVGEETSILQTFRQISHSAPPTELTSDMGEAGVEWETAEVILQRGESGFGFSIAGGSDNPHAEGDPAIHVTRVVEGGPAAVDGRLKLDDVIVAVNNFSVEYVTHAEAVEALKRAGKTLHLLVRRQCRADSTAPASVLSADQRPHDVSVVTSSSMELQSNRGGSVNGIDADSSSQLPPHASILKVELVKRNRGLGFSIAGGRGNEHVAGDPGIFITKVIEGSAAAADGRISVGDRLIRVNDTSLECVTHEEAVAALKATGDVVSLVFAQPFAASMSNFDQTDVASSVSFPSNFQSTTDGIYVDPGDSASVCVSEDLTQDPRRFFLKKGARGLGFNIVGGENGEGIFVSFILPGGPADKSRHLRKGDQLIAVNGVDLTTATHEEAAAVLKGAGETVEVIAAYKPEGFQEVRKQRSRGDYELFESKVQDIREQLQMPPSLSSALFNSAADSNEILEQRLSVNVRALFDYDPTAESAPSKGLAFRFGDLLHLLNASDDEWWQAKVLHPSSQEAKEGEGEADVGLIPSKKRMEKKEKSRLKRVNFHHRHPSSSGIDGNGSSGDSLDKKKKSSILRKLQISGSSTAALSGKPSDLENCVDEKGEEMVLTYEVVQQVELHYARPLIILGPLSSRLNDDLLTEFPEKFGSCVPHTTRQRREHEIDGRDYHFVTSREQMEQDIQAHLFIEAGQYNNNLYGTSVQSVREVAESGKHCMLDVSGNAIRRLQIAGLYPVAIFVRPRSVEHVLQLNKRFNEEQAKKIYDRAVKLEAEFYEYFTVIVSGESQSEIYIQVKKMIQDHSGPKVWISAPELQHLIN